MALLQGPQFSVALITAKGPMTPGTFGRNVETVQPLPRGVFLLYKASSHRWYREAVVSSSSKEQDRR